MEPLDATIHLAFAFDVGYEIDLERARGLLPGESAALARRKRTPESIRYRPAPLRLPVDPAGLPLPGGEAVTGPARAELSVFDFGAVSLAAAVPVRTSSEGLLRISGELAESATLTAAARRMIAPWVEKLRPVI